MTLKSPDDISMTASVRLAARRMSEYAEWSGLEMLCVDCDSQQVVAKSNPDLPDSVPLAVRTDLHLVRAVDLVEAPPSFLFFRMPIVADPTCRFVAIGAVHAEAPSLEANEPETTLKECSNGWTRTDAVCSAKVLKALLDSVVRRAELECSSCEVVDTSDPPDQSIDAFQLLRDVAQMLHVSRDAMELSELCMSRMREMIDIGGAAVWLQETHRASQLLRQGNVPFDELELACLIAQYDGHPWPTPLVVHDLQQTEIAEMFPGLNNFAIVPIGDARNRHGWVVGCNCSAGGQGFRDKDVEMIGSFATMLETHIRNTDLYRRHDELMLSFVRSLVTTLDAKDPYTRGHSQRVAHISRRIAEELGLPEPERQDIFLAGLLHDLGKVAVDDSTLRKEGELTEEEYLAIKEHPMIGYSILKDLTNLKAVLPGVRNHHESYDGSGYPDRLAGKDIPLMARILSVADSYDAMTSDRPYRIGMPLEYVEQILRKAAGRQWDPEVIEAYFACRDEIRDICKEFSPTDPLQLQAPATMADVLFHP